MPYKDKNKQKENRREYYLKNRDKIIAWNKIRNQSNKFENQRKAKEYYANHKEEKKIYNKQYRLKNKDFLAIYDSKKSKRLQQKYKQLIFSHYSNNTMKCAKCGFTDMRALSVDHINGGGTQHKKQIGTGSRFYRWLINNNFPPGFQVLCMNCQFIKRTENDEFRRKRSWLSFLSAVL